MADSGTTAQEAFSQALATADELLETVDLVEAPAHGLGEWFPERLSFLQARSYFRGCLRALHNKDDLVAGQLARSLFEETIRWSWVDEDRAQRRGAFLLEAQRRHRLFDQAADELGIEAGSFFGPIVSELLAAVDDQSEAFPRRLEDQLDWGGDELQQLLYTQYRLLSQYTHSSLLAAASTTDHSGEGLRHSGQVPLPARMAILRNACGNMVFIFGDCRQGVRAPEIPGTPFFAVLMGFATSVTDLVHPYSPGSA